MVYHWYSKKNDKKEILFQKIQLFLGEKFLNIFKDHTICKIFSDKDYNIYIQKFNKKPEYFAKIKEYDTLGFIKSMSEYLNIPKDTGIVNINGLMPKDIFLESNFRGVIDNNLGIFEFSIVIKPRIEKYVENGLISPENYEIINNAINTQKNILISSPSGSGKTSFLNILTQHINAEFSDDNIIVIAESDNKIIYNNNNVMRLGKKIPESINTEILLLQAEQLLPARILIDEVNEASLRWVNLLFSKKIKGSIATIRASSNMDAIDRLSNFCADTYRASSNMDAIDRLSNFCVNHYEFDAIYSSLDVLINLSKDERSNDGVKINDITIIDK